MRWISRAGVVGLGLALASWASAAEAVQYVITISVDGMGSSYMQKLIDQGKLPNLKRIEEEGATTINARADYDITVTLPNHTCMVTSRGILGNAGHNWTMNSDPKPDQTLHSNKGSYIASAFDVAHDAGLRTGMWATKTKFQLFAASYDKTNGAQDHGAKKMDVYTYNSSSPAMTSEFVHAMSTEPCNYAFVHYTDPDSAGHAHGWGSDEYNQSIVTADTGIGRILHLAATDPKLAGHTVVIVTADHGGFEKNHADSHLPLDYTIPFMVWGAGVEHGDLYAINSQSRQDPGTARPSYLAPNQPIRNGDAGNLALSLLGLGPIPGSTINRAQDLKASAKQTVAPASRPAA